MQQYFTAHSVHLDGNCDIDAKEIFDSQSKYFKTISVGIDDILYIKQSNSIIDDRQSLEQSATAVALHPKGDKCLLSFGNKLVERNLNTQSQELVMETLGKIRNINFSKTGKYICVATQQQKCLVIDKIKNRKMKCRPGHSNTVLHAFFSHDQKYVASIGQDRHLLVYQLTDNQEPQQVSRQKICRGQQSLRWKGSFHPNRHTIVAPGTQEIQLLEQVQNKWTLKKTNMKHPKSIVICQYINDSLIASCCSHHFYIWGINTQQKLIVVEDFVLYKIIPVGDLFFGVRNNGMIYEFNKILPSNSIQQKMDIEEKSEHSKIQFQQQQVQQQEQSQQSNYSIIRKKSKADRIITKFPQPPISSATNLFDQSRFLYTNLYGNVVERRQGEEVIIQLQNNNGQKNVLSRNRQFLFFALNQFGLVFANQLEFGFRGIGINTWEKKWVGIQNVALGNGWIAIVNDSEIRIFDLVGNCIRSISFDRQLVALDGYQNLLAIAYHESIPMWNTQQISMKIFDINMMKQLDKYYNHLPIKPESQLRWFGFSSEGMLFTQDTSMNLKAYSFQSNSWTSISLDNTPSTRRIWLVGVTNYQMKFWKTTQMQPEPTVFPRLNQKIQSVSLNTFEQQSTIGKILWKRFCLDHQKSRWKLWGHYKFARQQNNPSYKLSASIMSEKQIIIKNQQLDGQFQKIIKQLLETEQVVRGLLTAKSYVRSIVKGRNIVELFDQFQQRPTAIQLQNFYDQKEKELEYEHIQQLQLMQLKGQAQKSIKIKSNDPMKKSNKSSVVTFSSLGFSQTSSQVSLVRNEPKENKVPKENLVNQEPDNPFLKKKSSLNQQRKRQIEDQLSKQCIKKKSDDKSVIKQGKRETK